MARTSSADSLHDLAHGATAADALRNTLGKIEDKLIDMAMNSLFSGKSGGGFFSWLFGGFGGGQAAAALGSVGLFDRGGYTGPGGKYAPAGIVHAGEFVFSQDAVNRLGVANLDALHRSALRGYASGGVVTPAPMPRLQRSSVDSGDGAPSVTINAPVTVNATGGTPELNHDLARQVSKEMEATMRGVISDELRKQMRPGNTLGNVRHHR